MIGTTDATTVMAYRDSGSEVIDVARREVRIGSRLGKPTTIGVETGDVDPASITFFEEGFNALVDALVEVRSEFSNDPGFGGTAVHDHGSLDSLREHGQEDRPSDCGTFPLCPTSP